MPIVIITFAEFIEQQGTQPILVDRLGYLFQSGARSDGRYSHAEAPDDGPTKWKLQAAFLEASIAKMKARYKQIVGYVTAQAEMVRRGCGPPPEPGWQDALKSLSSRIAESTERLNAIKANLRSLTGDSDSLQRAIREETLNRERAASALIQELMNVPNIH